MHTTSLMTLSLLIGTSSFVTAEERPNRPDRPNRPLPAALLANFDTDKDGKLSDDEKLAMKAAMKAKKEERKAAMLAKHDQDGDGTLSVEEKFAMKADMQTKHRELLDKYDADHDGKLSPEEIRIARDAGEEVPSPAMRHGRNGKPRSSHHDALPPGPPAE